MTKAKINEYFVNHLPKSEKGRNIGVPVWRIVKAILYKLKTGVQWKYIPMRQFFGFTRYSWQSVYYHYNKWCKTNSWRKMYQMLLKKLPGHLDLSSINLDGSHTPVKRGGDKVGYQGRKKSKTTNILIITDNQGVPIASSDPISGNHNDSFELVKTASNLFRQMEASKLDCKGLFLNADAGFDTNDFKKKCYQEDIIPNVDKNKRRGNKEHKNDMYAFDDQLYKRRFVVEQLNAWVDGFKTLRVRYETTSRNWLQLHYMAFAIIFLRKAKLIEF